MAGRFASEETAPLPVKQDVRWATRSVWTLYRI